MRNWILFFSFLPFNFLSQNSEIKDLAKFLCSSSCFGRGYVNKGDSIAAAAIKNTFVANGLTPVKESYYQPFKLNVNTFPDTCLFLYNNNLLTPGKDYMVFPESNGIVGDFKTKLIPREIFFDTDYNFKKWLSNFKSNEIGVVNLTEFTKDENKTYYQRRAILLNTIPLIEITDNKFMWSVGRKVNPNALIQVQKNSIKFKENDTVRLSIKNKYFSNYSSQNVFGLLPTNKKNAKTIMITAHYDHLGMMGSECMFPGANDNASGIAMLISLIDELKRVKSRKYNYLFVAFGGEEAGLVGSAHMSKDLPVSKEKILFLLNLDIFGSGEEGIAVVNATLFEKQFKFLNKLNKRTKAVQNIKRRGPAANSDHYFFTELGIPSFFIYTEGPNKNYHDIYDTYENLSFAKFNELSQLLTKFLLKL